MITQIKRQLNIFLLFLFRLKKSDIPIKEKGLIIIQLDGVSHAFLTEAIKRGRCPFLAKLIHSQNFVLGKYYSPLPNSTIAAEMELFYGLSKNIPGYNWFDRERGIFVNGDLGDKMQIYEQEFAKICPHPLLENGSCLLGACRGGATLTTFTSEEKINFSNPISLLVKSRIILIPFLNPFRFWYLQFIMFKHFILGFLFFIKDHSFQEFITEYLRGLTRVYGGDIACVIGTIELRRESPALFINFGLYDKLAHHHGVGHKLCFESLQLIDYYCKAIYDQSQICERTYDLIVLSDHGQSDGIDFQKVNKISLNELLSDIFGSKLEVIQTHGNNSEKNLNGNDKLFVVPSSSLANVYFSEYFKNPLTQKELDQKYPGWLTKLFVHPGVGWVLVRDGNGGQILYSRTEKLRFKNGKAVDKMKDVLFADSVGKYAEFANLGDLVLFGNQIDGRVVNFETQVGTHGSFIGNMMWPFILTNNEKIIDKLYNDPRMEKVFGEIRKLR